MQPCKTCRLTGGTPVPRTRRDIAISQIVMKSPGVPAAGAQARYRYSGGFRPAGNGRHDTQDIVVIQWGLLFLQEADVFFADINVHETSQLTLFVVEVLAQIAVFGGKLRQRFAHGCGFHLHLVFLPHVLPKWSGDHDLNRHSGSSRLSRLQPAPLPPHPQLTGEVNQL